jgi:hypothetical protein
MREWIMATVAVVTSISFGGANEACFKRGLLSASGALPNIPPPFQASGNYDNATLRNLIRTAANSHPDLIVTAGGIATAQAAAAELAQHDPKFIYLAGVKLPANSPTTALAGGVNINAPVEDTARKKKLTNPPSGTDPGFGVNPGKIYLIVNANSPMADQDAHGWPPAKIAKFFDGAGANPDDPSGTGTGSFNAEFTNLQHRHPTPEGLVVTADPYFRLWRTAFTAALGSILAVPVCYPFHDFIDAINNQTGQPNIGNSTWLDLPKLNNPTNDADPDTAYFKLGKQAGRFLAGTANVQLVTWDGTQWGPPS